MLCVCSADAWYMLGQAHMGLGHYRAAISAFRRANQIDPANVHIRSAVLQAEQILEEVQQGKYAQATFSPGALNAGRNTAWADDTIQAIYSPSAQMLQQPVKLASSSVLSAAGYCQYDNEVVLIAWQA